MSTNPISRDISAALEPTATLGFVLRFELWRCTRRRTSTESPTRTSSTRRDPSRGADLLEVVTIVRADGSELAIHAMKMRPKYQRLLPGE
ncbi:MAG TPA: hypothetical protein VFI37_12100 [Gaiellaceae bacterium]|nr:hypothetical protein [Gaiellaceae bacterium]